MKKPDLGPWPAPGAARGPFAWSDDELAGVIRDNGIAFPVLTPEAEAEAQRENKFLEALESGVVREAFESGAIDRKSPGRKLVVGCPERARKCLDEAEGNLARARETFIENEMKSRNIQRKSAKNDWAKAMKALIPER